jgi:integrase
MGLPAMGSIRANHGDLFFDFRYRGQRCREYTKLTDTAANRKRMQAVLDKIEADISMGAFDYAKVFPGSKLAAKFSASQMAAAEPVASAAVLAATAAASAVPVTPLFKTFAETWYTEFLPGWRRSHRATLRSTLDRHLIPAFGEKPVTAITKSDVLQFRAGLVKLGGRNGNATLSAKTVNRIIQILDQILGEAGDRFGFVNPVDKIKRIPQKKTDVHPFSMEEVRLILSRVRADYRDYLTVRFFTGMRTGEVNGLLWKYVDFERRQILVRETLVRGEPEYTKTDGSQREVEMSQPVYEALQAQRKLTHGKPFVFCNREGEPIDLDNFTNRVWYSLLRHLGLTKRRPYQMRHTCATLWLGAGENPEWVARQLGHSDTTMLFKTYSRFIPNLTRRDGSAFNRFLTGALHPEVHHEV